MSVVFTLKYILRWRIFVSDGSEEHRNGALNVVGFSILSPFEKIESSQSYLRGVFTTSSI